MKYLVRIVPAAERQFHKLQPALQSRLKIKIFDLESEPRPYGCQKLQGSDFFRIRVGDYRIIYSINDMNKIVMILDIGHRREVYRGW